MVLKEQKINDRVKINTEKNKSVVSIVKNIFDIKFIPYILVLFFVAALKILEAEPLAYTMLAAATIFNVPLMIPLIVSLISFFVFKSPSIVIVNYIITYTIYTIITSAINIHILNKIYTAIIKMIISFLISSIIILMFNGFNLSQIIQDIINLLLIITLYPIFASGMTVIFNINKKMIFSSEEIISTIIVFAFVLMPFATIHILGISIVSVILTILIVLISWQNDWRIGCTTAVALSFIYLIITKGSPLIFTTFIFSGLIVGLFNRFSKWPLTFIFIIGNILIILAFSASLMTNSKILEIAFVAIAILMLPKNVIFHLRDIFSSEHGLREGYNNILGPGSDIKNRSGSIGEIFENIVNYNIPVTDQTIRETEFVVKKYLEEYKNNRCITCKDKSTCLKDNIGIVSKHIAMSLEGNLAIKKELLPIDCILKEEMLSNIQDIYANIKLMRIVKAKDMETNKKVYEEYISAKNLVDNISNEICPIKKETSEQKKIKEELKFLGYVVYQDSLEIEDGHNTYEFLTDILIDINKAKNEIQKVVSEILGKEMTINMVLNISKTEKSKIKLIPKN